MPLQASYQIPIQMSIGTITKVFDSGSANIVNVQNFQTIPGSTDVGFHMDEEGALGSQVTAYAALVLDLSKYQPAKLAITQVLVEAEFNLLPTPYRAPSQMGVNIWHGGSVGPDVIGGSGAAVSIQPSNLITSANQLFKITTAENADISPDSAITLSVGVAEAALSANEEIDWLTITQVTLLYTPIITVVCLVTDNLGNPLANASVVLSNTSTGAQVGTGVTGANGQVAFPNLLADQFTLKVTLGSRTLSSLLIGFVNPGQSHTITVPFTFSFPTPVLLVNPTTASAGQSISFNPSFSSDPTGTLTKEVLNFGDGTVITLLAGQAGFLATMNHAYNCAGTFMATLTVTNDAGLSATATVAVTITGGTVFVLVKDSKNLFYPNIPVNLVDSTGLVVKTVSTDATGLATFPSTLPGTYTVLASLALNKAPGITKTASVSVTSTTTATAVLVWHYPTATFAVFNGALASIDAGFPLVFDATKSSTGEADTSFFLVDFDWGDGTHTTDSNAVLYTSHTWDLSLQGKSTTVVLTVMNDAGLPASILQVFPININFTAFMFWFPVAIVGESLFFYPIVGGGASPGGAYEFYNWDFGDGTPPVQLVNLPPSMAFTMHTFTAPGVYQVTLRVTDFMANTLTVVQPIPVSVGAPVGGGRVPRPL